MANFRNKIMNDSYTIEWKLKATVWNGQDKILAGEKSVSYFIVFVHKVII